MVSLMLQQQNNALQRTANCQATSIHLAAVVPYVAGYVQGVSLQNSLAPIILLYRYRYRYFWSKYASREVVKQTPGGWGLLAADSCLYRPARCYSRDWCVGGTAMNLLPVPV